MHRWLKNGLVIALLLGTAFYALAEDITLTTYYPSPRGVYQELKTAGNMVVGNIATAPGARLHVIQDDPASAVPVFRADDETSETSPFIVDATGNVGIGIETPTQKLEVNGAMRLTPIAAGSSGPAVYASQGAGVLALTGSANGFAFRNEADATNLVRITNTGSVGIGTANPTANLEVAGNVKITDGTQGNGKVLTSDATGQASWQFAIIPPGAVMFFDAGVCPPGWTELATAQGRYLVGAKPGAAIGSTVGNDLNVVGGGPLMENRVAGAHRHKETTYVTVGPGPAGGVIALPDAVFSVYAFTGAGPARQLQTGTIQEVVGTNAPYMQLLVCRKD